MTTTNDAPASDVAQAETTDSTASETTGTTPEAPGTDATQTFDAKYVATLRAEAAKFRIEAKANADAAKKLAEIEDANKSEVQRFADAKAAAEADAATARADALRWRIAAKHGIGDDEAELFLTGSDEATLTRQAEVLASMRSKTVTPTTPGTTPTPAPAPRADLSQGARGGSTANDPASQFATFLNGQLNKH